jgi:hypothetical protein
MQKTQEIKSQIVKNILTIVFTAMSKVLNATKSMPASTLITVITMVKEVG